MGASSATLSEFFANNWGSDEKEREVDSFQRWFLLRQIRQSAPGIGGVGVFTQGLVSEQGLFFVEKIRLYKKVFLE